ncbi:hypothetical protein [Roseofilum sp. Guam]|uniref:hypothetical protein n=1 Tax=Roseofilum sp. Guam TaxID=2821502 RepID=UPI001B2BF3CE|nr:hypothetical protein [Roseofilum sp. Guam]MBP0031444.1 hypothetical protein [Roseofilum sp. Guam]
MVVLEWKKFEIHPSSHLLGMRSSISERNLTSGDRLTKKLGLEQRPLAKRRAAFLLVVECIA